MARSGKSEPRIEIGQQFIVNRLQIVISISYEGAL